MVLGKVKYRAKEAGVEGFKFLFFIFLGGLKFLKLKNLARVWGWRGRGV